MKNIALTLAALFTLSTVSTASSAGKLERSFAPVPAMHGEKERPFELRIVSYDGSTNGALTVEVKNATKVARTFDAQGLYFIPQVSANEAPQRLGAVGALQTRKGTSEEWTYGENALIPAGSVVRVKLDVFCIDSHRASPTSSTPFALAKDRLPQQLAGNIRSAAKKAADSVGGYAAPAAKSSMQSEVWKNRDADWIQLEGEGSQEVGK
jgi:hypothetical protein